MIFADRIWPVFGEFIMKKKRRIQYLFMAVWMVGWALPLAAQTLDTGIVGTVSDPAGASVA